MCSNKNRNNRNNNFKRYKNIEINGKSKDNININIAENVKQIKGEYSGTLECQLINITPLYTEGMKPYSGENNDSNKNNRSPRNNNNLSVATTLKSAIRKTSFYINKELSCSIFGTTEYSGKIYFVLKNVKVDKGNLKIPELFSPQKSNNEDEKYKENKVEKDDRERLYYNRISKNYNKNKDNYTGNKLFEEFKIYLNKVHIKNKKSQILNGVYLPKSCFVFNIIFKNMSEEELKLLIYSLEIHKQNYYNQIGMGKSLGMGIVEIKINGLYLDEKEKYLNLFYDNKNNKIDEYRNKVKKDLKKYDFKDENLKEIYKITDY